MTVRRLLPMLGCVLLGCVVLTLYAPDGIMRREEPPPAPSDWSPYDLAGSIEDVQNRLRRHPGDDALWARLGHLYLEQAGRTTDTAYHDKARGAFARSLRLSTGGGKPSIDAMIGLGALAN